MEKWVSHWGWEGSVLSSSESVDLASPSVAIRDHLQSVLGTEVSGSDLRESNAGSLGRFQESS